ncbi:Os03g0622500 [Oryza sativa Japonica Group]|uniref:Os03g0622500 protein n=1 Tax=Oryza sativa subsp. japonica TaxID=39947 RepID=A0A0P0W120_ORYSJ|nr:hypothetical protein EE612_018995 [Oryza sativa]BAS85320.1 Os03g0622500 [Oryza sativa Japonica Group]
MELQDRWDYRRILQPEHTFASLPKTFPFSFNFCFGHQNCSLRHIAMILVCLCFSLFVTDSLIFSKVIDWRLLTCSVCVLSLYLNH